MKIYRVNLRNIRQIVKLCPVIVCGIFLVLYVTSQPDRFESRSIYLKEWFEGTKFCGGNFTGYSNRFFKLKSTVFDPVANNFKLVCRHQRGKINYHFFQGHAPRKYSQGLEFVQSLSGQKTLRSDITMVVNREYPHNFYHAMTQWYNIFFLSKYFHFDISDVSVLLLDRGPVVHIDAQWKDLYKEVVKANELSSSVYLDNAIFSIPGHESPLYYFDVEQLPYVEEFSARFLKAMKINSRKTLNCYNLTVTLAIRRDYFFHPEIETISKRNTQRKFKNEEEILSTLKHSFKGHNIRTLVSEDMTLREQLELTTNTDILIGMHGCALTHTMFMPQHGSVLELYPKYWNIQRFFSSIARWRDIRYEYWRNSDPSNEFVDHYTYVPPRVLSDYAARVKRFLGCSA